MRILGISAFYHDSSAALVQDGEIAAAEQEERFSPKKHDPSFPHNAIDYCLAEAGASIPDLDHVVFYDKPFLKFERLLNLLSVCSARSALVPHGHPSVDPRKAVSKKSVRKGVAKHGPFDGAKLLFTEHHQSHAASAFLPSLFPEAAF